MARLAGVVVAVLLSGCGAQTVATPCSACQDVSGTYFETVEFALPSRAKDCGELASTGGSGLLVVSQPEGRSGLSIQSGFGGGPLEATLHQDLTITTVETSAVAPGGVTGTISLSGRFNVGGAGTFEGRYTFKRDDCSLEVTTQWTLRQ